MKKRERERESEDEAGAGEEEEEEEAVVVSTNTPTTTTATMATMATTPTVLPKKRGRKPKGGKMVTIVAPLPPPRVVSRPPVVLFLKCKLSEAKSQSTIASSSWPRFGNTSDVSSSSKPLYFGEDGGEKPKEENSANHPQVLLKKKIGHLQHQLHLGLLPTQNVACFWCTEPFENPAVYIPKHVIQQTYHVYGCFCTPECAAAYLLQENIDSSAKYERYALLNYLYGFEPLTTATTNGSGSGNGSGAVEETTETKEKEKNDELEDKQEKGKTFHQRYSSKMQGIRPAPDPRYTLSKFFGNLTIQEYRSLHTVNRLFLIINKPVTRVFPELHDDHEDRIARYRLRKSNMMTSSQPGGGGGISCFSNNPNQLTSSFLTAVDK